MAVRRVVVTGMGAVTPLGADVTSSWRRLLEGGSGVKSIPWLKGLPTTLAALAQQPSFTLQQGDDRKTSRFIYLSLAATQEALMDAQWHPSTRQEKERTGVSIASGIGSVDDFSVAKAVLKEQGYRKISPFAIPKALVNMAAGWTAIYHGFMGPNHCISTACAAGTHAVADAARLIMLGDADVMITGASESSITPVCVAGFARAKALCTAFEDAPSEASRPFDTQRSGFVMAEGAGTLVLEERQHALSRGAKVYAELIGYGSSGDAHHITAPLLDGYGAILCMNHALKRAGLPPSSVSYINCHATSTPRGAYGDISEIRAIRSVFKEHVTSLALSSTKGATGHLLGAAGAVEAIFTILAINEDTVPPTINLHKADPEAVDLNLTPLRPLYKNVDIALTNSFGFGGTNGSLLFCKHNINK